MKFVFKLTLLCLLSICHVRAKKKYFDYTVVDEHNETLYDSMTPMDYLMRTNKTFGVGYTVGYDRNINLYSEPNTFNVRSTPANYTFYFYRDNDKYYIRDEECSFLCANPCGVVFMSKVRLQHYCKFYVEKHGHNVYSIFATNNGPTGVIHKTLDFERNKNMVFAQVTNNVTRQDGAMFHLKHGPRLRKVSCPAIMRVPQRNLAAEGRMCHIDPSIILNKNSLPTTESDVYVRKDHIKYYRMRTGVQNRVFTKSLSSNNAYVLRDSKTCQYLCQSNMCGVYMSDYDVEGECNFVFDSTSRSSFYIRLPTDNYYLSYNDTTGVMNFSHTINSRVEFYEVLENDPNTECLQRQKKASTCGKPLNGVTNTLTINLPNLFLFLVLNKTLVSN
ncbi:fibroblast growth factor 2 [Phthorimaea operculella granulovirus]|uniref:Fibroblast growth factor 2 n=1 Tax=Phthorimaea operculella granulovirus TaxID=192584 RepID=Q8JRU3_9BBAC|nr:fibroblast growth factor 2 [Phthorimaea operculella granulovirus]AAM70314.1 fibroblast growth factor 2 [Phthorimaea operculella granulovirus]ANY57505.1 fibroblast growth factor 2 [Phthorimaea operculella granulovirus]QBH65951.1 fibroblast growth factor 2 [Phthorimaea operculella granulovirus]QBH66081.1 fibroblast growth factor 2 [Phthorimaea operculella granulovirus]QBH66211.1 fibroblast growth factor 2 [Phthorimaea operculella granulovirus]